MSHNQPQGGKTRHEEPQREATSQNDSKKVQINGNALQGHKKEEIVKLESHTAQFFYKFPLKHRKTSEHSSLQRF